MERELYIKEETKKLIQNGKPNLIVIEGHFNNKGYKTILEFDRQEWEANRNLVDPNFINKDSYDKLFLQPVFFKGLKNNIFKEGKLISLQFFIFEEVYSKLVSAVKNRFSYELEIRKRAIEIKSKNKKTVEYFRVKICEFVPEIFKAAYDISLRYRKKTYLIESKEKFDIDTYLIGGLEASNIKIDNFFEEFFLKKSSIKDIYKEIEYLTEFYFLDLTKDPKWLK